MWALFILPVAAILFAVGMVAGLVWFLASPKQKRPHWVALVALPFGFVAAPFLALIVLMMLGSALQKTDLQLYQEVFGEGTTVAEQAMLFDDFGRGRTREIYMRISPDVTEREFLLNLPGSKPSETTLEAFVSRGERHGFIWWPSTDPDSHNYCESARILEADGFRGWRELRIAECLDSAETFPAPMDRGEIYVIAWHREE
jgi:hypothetical protein